MNDNPTLPAPPPGGWPGHILQFSISRAAAAAIDIDTANVRGRAAGVPDFRLETSAVKGAPDHVHVTTSFPMAVYLVELLQVAAGKGDVETLIACAGAVKVILDELERSSREPRITAGQKPNRMG